MYIYNYRCLNNKLKTFAKFLYSISDSTPGHRDKTVCKTDIGNEMEKKQLNK